MINISAVLPKGIKQNALTLRQYKQVASSLAIVSQLKTIKSVSGLEGQTEKDLLAPWPKRQIRQLDSKWATNDIATQLATQLANTSFDINWTDELSLSLLCQHSFEHNRKANAMSIMPA